MGNPIKYSDLISPDNSITDLIKQLDELSDAYMNTLENIKSEAIALAESLKKVSGATEEGRKHTSKAVTDAERLAKAQRELMFAESENAKKLADLRQATKEQNDINKLMVKINQSAEGSYNRLSAQYSLNKIYLNNMTQEERDAAEATEGLVTKTKNLYEEMKRLQEETGKHQLNVGNYAEGMSEAMKDYEGSILGALGMNNQFGQSLLSLGKGGEEGKKAFTAVADGAKAMGKTLLSLMANPVFLAVAGLAAAGAAFKWWYDYNAGLVEATRLTQQFTGKSGEDLKMYRSEVQAVSDFYGKDFRDTLAAANTLTKQFGITSEEAMTLVKDGLAYGGDVNGDFLDTLKEYPAYFKEAGISAEGFVAITTQAAKEGVFSDKGVDAIKEANLRLREMTASTASALDGIGISSEQVQRDLQAGTKTTFEVMQEVSAKLAELPDNAQSVGTAIADIFGGPGEDAGLQYLRTLKDISTEMDGVKGKSSEIEKLNAEQLESQIELEKAMAGLFDMTGGTFEYMTTKAKTFVNGGLAAIMNGIAKIINYVIDLYNNSKAVRIMWFAVSASFKNGINAIGGAFSMLVDMLKGVGNMVKGVFTLEWDSFTKGYEQFTKAFPKMVKEQMAKSKEIYEEGIKGINGSISPIKVPVTTEDVKEGQQPRHAATPGAKGKEPGKGLPGDGGNGNRENAEKELENAYKKNMDAKRKLEDALLSMEAEGWEKRRKQAEYQYGRQIEDLQRMLDKEKGLTSTERQSAAVQILALEEQRDKALEKIEEERQAQELATLKEGIDLRLSAVKEGSVEELKLRLELIEAERKAELLANKKRAEAQRMDEKDINAKYDKEKQSLLKDFIPDSAIETAAERRAKELQAERENLNAILEMVENGQLEVDAAIVESYRNRLSEIDSEAAGLVRDNVKAVVDEALSMLDGFDIDFSDPIDSTKKLTSALMDLKDAFKDFDLSTLEGKKAIIETVSLGFNLLTEAAMQAAQAQLEEAQASVEAAEKKVDSAQSALDAEREARANGYASNVAAAQRELDLAKKNQEEALKEQEKAQKRQEAIQTVQQIGNLVTATSLIWTQLGFPLAIPAIAVMWASFAASKIMAASLAKKSTGTETYGEGTVELLQGGSHQSGNDVDLGVKPDGTRRRAEGGEFFAVINKRNSRRFRRYIPDVVRSLNDGSFPEKYLNAYKAANGMTLHLSPGGNPDLRALAADVKEIKEQNKRRVYVDGRGNRVETYKNLKRKIKEA